MLVYIFVTYIWHHDRINSSSMIKKKKEGRLGNQNHTIFFFTLVDSRKCQIPSFREFFKEMDI